MQQKCSLVVFINQTLLQIVLDQPLRMCNKMFEAKAFLKCINIYIYSRSPE